MGLTSPMEQLPNAKSRSSVGMAFEQTQMIRSCQGDDLDVSPAFCGFNIGQTWNTVSRIAYTPSGSGLMLEAPVLEKPTPCLGRLEMGA